MPHSQSTCQFLQSLCKPYILTVVNFLVAGDFTKCYCLHLKKSEFLIIFLMVQMLLLQVLVSKATAAWARRREEVRGHWAAVAVLYVLV